MNCRLKKKSERGIALVITLVMLSIVTVMAIIFLGVSRRERASVKVGEDIANANYMADAATERAKAEAIARMIAEGSKLYYDLFNSRSYINRDGFDSTQSPTALPNQQNVSYVDKSGNVLRGAPYLRMLANLQYDPRVPVFVETNANRDTDFRYYLDFDRNQLVETNGVVPIFDNNGNKVDNAFADLVGDPEWIGVLERPDLPHSETNRFVGRLAYLVLPAGKTLDVNFIHNQANPTSPDLINVARTQNGFTRNQGVGSWEINLAAFLRELNTNAWRAPTYSYSPGQIPTGEAFDNARSFLAFRYNNRRYLDTPVQAFARDLERPDSLNVFDRDEVDQYGDGPFDLNAPIFQAKANRENDTPGTRPWPGSFTTNAFTDLQQFYSLSQDFTNRLIAPLKLRSTYDRYQFYRMAAQLGVDSVPSVKGKVQLNFVNEPGKITNTFLSWAAPTLTDPRLTNNSTLRFFTNAANAMLRASIDKIVLITNRSQALFWGRQLGTYYLIGDTLVATNFSVNNIQIYAPFHTNYPNVRQSEYSPAIHRVLQVAANIYDNMTNRFGISRDKAGLPSVFKPIYRKTATNLYISGWMEVTNVSQVVNTVAGTTDLYSVFTNRNVRLNETYSTGLNPYGQHLVIGAKKGYPNFNELALQSSTEIARKLEVTKQTEGGKTAFTNQMFLFSLQQRWGMESWNSYSNRYDRSMNILADVQSTIGIKDGTNLLQAPLQVWSRRANRVVAGLNNWLPFTNENTTNFQVILSTNFPLLVDVGYSKLEGFKNTNRFTVLEEVPRFVINTTNHVRYIATDQATQRIVDYVSFDNLVTTMDLSNELYPRPTTSTSQFGSGATDGNNEDIY